MQKTVVSDSATLLDILQRLVPGTSRRTLRQFLEQERVKVNGVVCKKAAFPVQAGTAIEIGPRRENHDLPAGLQILFEDSAILVVQKPPGLLTVATPNEREETAFAYLREYAKKRNPRQTLQIVHRLDKFASGLLVFAKNEDVRMRLKDLFSRHDIRRKYWAIVEGNVEKNQGTIRSFLVEDKNFRVHSVENAALGKPAVTHFRVLKRRSGLSALEVTLETGRKNQIRVHLSEMGHPVAGDRAYGSGKNPLGRLGLHAFHLGFIHPTRKVPVEFSTDPPPEFVPYLPK
jgi:23S rRNA pseudouridine1911/1915/1917 synthase